MDNFEPDDPREDWLLWELAMYRDREKRRREIDE